ncbi:sulfatase-like hydrolase/transferase [Mameliella alba]|uniref:sulfatase-like hydrolase/transferase n=1 Tax=Mameliella alba TaxID=561184 RepID=UPI001FD826E3|nr:sulfatase-like hydrolase/transferase [Mameliella alba]
MRKTPNVLFLMADEHQALALSCLGHDVVQTPNLDRLAERGTLFENAYTPSPICVPARAALATGQPVHQTGYWDNATAYDGRVPSWGHRLQAAGVPVTSIGKLHYRDDSDLTGFDRQILPMHIQHGIGQVWGSVRNPLPDHPHGGEMLGGIGAGLSKYNRYDMNVAEAAEGFLSERARDESPWAAFVSFVAPHFPLIVPQDYLDLYPAKDMPLRWVGNPLAGRTGVSRPPSASWTSRRRSPPRWACRPIPTGPGALCKTSRPPHLTPTVSSCPNTTRSCRPRPGSCWPIAGGAIITTSATHQSCSICKVTRCRPAICQAIRILSLSKGLCDTSCRITVIRQRWMPAPRPTKTGLWPGSAALGPPMKQAPRAPRRCPKADLPEENG